MADFDLGLAAEDHPHVLKRGAVLRQPAGADGGAVSAVARLGKAEPDLAGPGEIRRHGHVQEPALALVVDLGQALQRRRQLAVAVKPQGAGLFGDEQAAIGQKRHAPRIAQPLDQRGAGQTQGQRQHRGAGLAGEGRRLAPGIGRRVVEIGQRGGAGQQTGQQDQGRGAKGRHGVISVTGGAARGG